MRKKRTVMKGLSLLVSSVFVFSFIISCGGGGGSSLSSADQVAASSSVGMAAISLSEVVGSAAQIASDSIPQGYAPGKSGSSMKTAPLAKIDPRLKDVVDKMVAQLQKPAVKASFAKVGSYKTVSSAPLSSVTGSCSMVTSSSVISSGTSTTYVVRVDIDHCKDYVLYEELYGSITATHTVDTSNQYDSKEVAAALTAISYTDVSLTTWDEKAELVGTFSSQVAGNIISNGSGTNSANGTFTVTTAPSHPFAPDLKMSFNFTNVNDVWTISTVGSDVTTIHTANGNYSLGITSNFSTNPQTITLSIGLTNLENKIKDYSNLDEEMWINGGITVSWTPDLSQWGCLNGTYNFTTADGTPIYTPGYSYCPTSGTLQVNNATVEFGSPSGEQVTVSLTGGPSKVFPDCTYLGGGGMCSI